MRFRSILATTCGLVLSTAICAQTASAQAQAQPAPTAPSNYYPPALYQMNDVSKTLNLTQDQINRLNKVTAQAQAQYRDDYNRLSALNEAERSARLQELNRQYNTAWNRGATDIFNDSQRGRYQQFNYQYGGFNTFYDPDVQKRLGLTEAQIKDLQQNSGWSDQQLQEINRIGATDATRGGQMYRDYWRLRQDRMNRYLTPEQQKTWQEMIGEPYTFQPSFAPPR